MEQSQEDGFIPLEVFCAEDQLFLKIVFEATTAVMKMVTEEREGVKID